MGLLSWWRGKFADRGGVVLDKNAGLVNTGTIKGNVYLIQEKRRELLELALPFRQAGPDSDLFTLLSWRSQATVLIGRDREMDSLLRWAEGSDVRIKLLIGPGGIGKTRLAAELAAALRAREWEAGFLDFLAFGHTGTPGGIRLGERGTLVIIDYPEANREALRHLLGLLARRTEVSAPPLRLLLLTRASFEQWQGDFDLTDTTALLDQQPLKLVGLPEQDPYMLFRAAVNHYANRIQQSAQPIAADRFRSWIDQDRERHR